MSVEIGLGFMGTVTVQEPHPGPGGGWTGGYYGYLTIYEASDLGIKPARGEAQWVVKVSGDTDFVYVPGCQVAIVHRGRMAYDDRVVQHPDGTKTLSGEKIWEVP